LYINLTLSSLNPTGMSLMKNNIIGIAPLYNHFGLLLLL